MAAVDLTQGQQPLPRAEPAVPGDHDLAATLKALAANSSSFGGNQAAAPSSLDPDDIDPEMISRSVSCHMPAYRHLQHGVNSPSCCQLTQPGVLMAETVLAAD